MDDDCDGVECPQADGAVGCCVGHPDWVCCALGLVCASDPAFCSSPRMTLERMARKAAHTGDHQANIMKTSKAVMDDDTGKDGKKSGSHWRSPG